MGPCHRQLLGCHVHACMKHAQYMKHEQWWAEHRQRVSACPMAGPRLRSSRGPLWARLWMRHCIHLITCAATPHALLHPPAGCAARQPVRPSMQRNCSPLCLPQPSIQPASSPTSQLSAYPPTHPPTRDGALRPHQGRADVAVPPAAAAQVQDPASGARASHSHQCMSGQPADAPCCPPLRRHPSSFFVASAAKGRGQTELALRSAPAACWHICARRGALPVEYPGGHSACRISAPEPLDALRERRAAAIVAGHHLIRHLLGRAARHAPALMSTMAYSIATNAST